MKARNHSFLECRALAFERAKGIPPVLKDFELTVGEGEFVCILGPSGCGKTSLLNLLAGFLQPTGGQALLEGAPILSASRDRGVIFQSDDALFGWLTARENVGFGLKMQGASKTEWQSKADHYLELVGLSEHAAKLPDELSGGMKQRVQIARALANEPKILLMDEPFAALDAQTRSMMQSELVRIWSETGKTIVFITHDIGEAVILADRIAIMTAGPSSRVKATIEVKANRPRLQTSLEYFEHTQRCYELIQEEVNGSMLSRRPEVPVLRHSAVAAPPAMGEARS